MIARLLEEQLAKGERLGCLGGPPGDNQPPPIKLTPQSPHTAVRPSGNAQRGLKWGHDSCFTSVGPPVCDCTAQGDWIASSGRVVS